MDSLEKLRLIPDNTPCEIVRHIYANANNWSNGAVSWLEPCDGEVIQRIWFFRNYKVHGREETRYTECVRKISGEKRIVWRNGYFHGGYSQTFQPVYRQADIKGTWYGYEDLKFKEEDFNLWREERVDFFAMYVPVLNLPALAETKYKYCAYPDNCDLMRYLKIYAGDPSVEFFGKCGLYPFPSLVKLAKTEKAFCRFLRDNAVDVDLYGPQAAVYAYKNRVSVVEARRICEQNAREARQLREYISELKDTTIDKHKLFAYLENLNKNLLGYHLAAYNDYLRAIKGLGLDLNDTKNIYPKDFWRMHDLRVDEYAAIEAKKDRERRKAFYDAFSQRARELKSLEWIRGDYTVIIPGDVSDLIREGRILNHCVGKMGYDAKVIKGVSIIAFLRRKARPEKPLYTLEFRIDLNKLSQCYGKSDTTPPKDARDTADAWAEFVKTQLKEIKDNENRTANSEPVRAGA